MRDPTAEPAPVRIALIGFAMAVMAVLVLLPLGVVVTEALRPGLAAAWEAIRDPDTLSALRLTLLVAAVAVPVNAVCGLAAAWCLARFRFPGQRLLAVLVELPFTVSPVVVGLAWMLLFGAQGVFGPVLAAHGIRVAFAYPGLVLATAFVSFPFVARTVLPLLEAQGSEQEEAALTLGAGGWQMFRRVTLPRIRWALLSGVLLCNARAMGEFGAVSVISGRIRGETATLPLQVQMLYDDYRAPAAFAVAGLLASLAVVTLVTRAGLERLSYRSIT